MLEGIVERLPNNLNALADLEKIYEGLYRNPVNPGINTNSSTSQTKTSFVGSIFTCKLN
jgi:hypothetical protein